MLESRAEAAGGEEEEQAPGEEHGGEKGDGGDGEDPGEGAVGQPDTQHHGHDAAAEPDEGDAPDGLAQPGERGGAKRAEPGGREKPDAREGQAGAPEGLDLDATVLNGRESNEQDEDQRVAEHGERDEDEMAVSRALHWCTSCFGLVRQVGGLPRPVFLNIVRRGDTQDRPTAGYRYRGWDSNPYDRSPGILSPVRLPFRHPGKATGGVGAARG